MSHPLTDAAIISSQQPHGCEKARNSDSKYLDVFNKPAAQAKGGGKSAPSLKSWQSQRLFRF